jgi:hypothetical protein
MRLASILAALLLAAVSIPSFAQTARVRGEIEKFHHSVLTVKAQDGAVYNIELGDGVRVTAMTAASVADITAGKFVGTAAQPGGPNGQLVALEVHIFAESMRGTGEGHRAMERENTMTNATVENVVEGMHDRVLTLRYQGGEQHVLIPEGVPIVMLSPSTRDALKVGEHVSLNATKQPGGVITAARVTVGVNGVIPPL